MSAASVSAEQVPPETGAGTQIGTWSQTFGGTTGLNPLCLEVTASTLTLDQLGRYTATDATTPIPTIAVYNGPSRAVVTQVGGSYWINPAGTFSDPNCLIPALAPVSVTINGTNTLGDTVACATSLGAPGSYTRVVEAAVVQFNARCTVTIASSGLSVTSTGLVGTPLHTFEAAQQPCLPLPVDPCAAVGEWIGTYTET